MTLQEAIEVVREMLEDPYFTEDKYFAHRQREREALLILLRRAED